MPRKKAETSLDKANNASKRIGNKSLKDLIAENKGEESDEEVLNLEEEEEESERKVSKPRGLDKPSKGGMSEDSHSLKDDAMFRRLEETEKELKRLKLEKEEEKKERELRKAEKAKKKEEDEKTLKELREDYARRQTQKNFIGGAIHRNVLDIGNAIKF